MSDQTDALALRLEELGVRPIARFSRPDLIVEALTHSSFATESGTRHYERLEMLGDAILGFAVADLLFALHPDAVEGVLTRQRAVLVRTGALAARARELGLPPIVRLGRGEDLSGGREREALLADIFEATVAALYLSEGLPLVQRLVERLFRADARRLDSTALDRGDHKTAFQERTQAFWKLQPAYRVTATHGAEHARTFIVEAILGGEVVGTGEGRTKKEAQQAAARAALQGWAELEKRIVPNRGTIAGPAREP